MAMVSNTKNKEDKNENDIIIVFCMPTPHRESFYLLMFEFDCMTTIEGSIYFLTYNYYDFMLACSILYHNNAFIK